MNAIEYCFIQFLQLSQIIVMYSNNNILMQGQMQMGQMGQQPFHPLDGAEVLIMNNSGGYISGKTEALGLRIIINPSINELYRMSGGNTYAFNHVNTNLLIGGTSERGKCPFLVTNQNVCQNFVIEESNGSYLIRNKDNLYLMKDEYNNLSWNNRSVQPNFLWRFRRNPGTLQQYIAEQPISNVNLNPYNNMTQGFGMSQVIPPRQGLQYVIMSSSGGYLGGNSSEGQPLFITDTPTLLDVFRLQFENGRYSLRCKINNWYVGGTCEVNRSPSLVNHKQACEYYTFQIKNAGIAIRNKDGTYICKNGRNIIFLQYQQSNTFSWIFKPADQVVAVNSMGMMNNINNMNLNNIGTNNFGINNMSTLSNIGNMTMGNNYNLNPSYPRHGDEVNIVSAQGGYLAGSNIVGNSLTVTSLLTPAQIYIIETTGDGRFSFRCKFCNYYFGGVSALNGSPNLQNHKLDCEYVTLEPRRGVYFAIKSKDGFYLTRLGNNLTFTYICNGPEQLWSFTPAVNTMGGFGNNNMNTNLYSNTNMGGFNNLNQGLGQNQGIGQQGFGQNQGFGQQGFGQNQGFGQQGFGMNQGFGQQGFNNFEQKTKVRNQNMYGY